LAAAIAMPCYQADRGAGTVRVGRWTMENAGVSMGESVKVRKASAKLAVCITLKPEVEIVADELFLAYAKKRPVNRWSLATRYLYPCSARK